jgi:hypothetical protein
MDARLIRFRLYAAMTAGLAVLVLSACSAHMNPVELDLRNQESLKTIGLLQFNMKKYIEIRQENPAVALIGVSALILHQLTWEYKRRVYQDANPELLDKALKQLRYDIKRQLRKQGYVVKDLPMNFWQAQAAYRKKDARLKDINALLDLQIKRFGYFTGSPFKPYRPGVVLVADLVSTKSRKQLSSHVYNVGFDADDLSLFILQLNYATNIPVTNRKYFYRNFNALMSDAKQSAVGLESVMRAAAETVTGDLKKRAVLTNLAFD